MIFSIHQPSYFPWLGLLHKIASSDVFIVLDDVQLSDSAFQHRNLFLTNDGKAKYLSIPFVKDKYLETKFKDLLIADESWASKHSNFLINNYKKHKFFDCIYPLIQPIFLKKTNFLFDIVMESIDLSMRCFEIKTKVLMQSQLNYDTNSKKSDLVLSLLKTVNASNYLSGRGAEAYQNRLSFDKAGIKLFYQNFLHPIYQQKNSKQFVSGLSCLDLLFNLGNINAMKEINLRLEQ